MSNSPNDGRPTCVFCGKWESSYNMTSLFEVEIPPDKEFGETEPTKKHVCGECWSTLHALTRKFVQPLVDAIAELQEWKEEMESDERLAFNVKLYSGE